MNYLVCFEVFTIILLHLKGLIHYFLFNLKGFLLIIKFEGFYELFD